MTPPFYGAFDDSPRPDARRPIGFTAHIIACVVDALSLLAVLFAGGLIFGLVWEIFPAFRSIPEVAGELGLIGIVLLCTVGDIFVEASPGKWVFGLAIRTGTGEPAPLGQLALRWLLKYGPLILLAVYVVIDFVGSRLGLAGTPWFAWPLHACEDAATFWAYGIVGGTLLALLPSRRTLHDRLAGTAVYTVPVRRSEFEAAIVQRGFEVTPVPLPATPEPAPSDSPS
jgi:uncharacterized RDD family membrane protein YckC